MTIEKTSKTKFKLVANVRTIRAMIAMVWIATGMFYLIFFKLFIPDLKGMANEPFIIVAISVLIILQLLGLFLQNRRWFASFSKEVEKTNAGILEINNTSIPLSDIENIEVHRQKMRGRSTSVGTKGYSSTGNYSVGLRVKGKFLAIGFGLQQKVAEEIAQLFANACGVEVKQKSSFFGPMFFTSIGRFKQ